MLKGRMAFFAAALAGATMAASPSLAADPTYWDQPSPTFDWSGFYVGAHGGWANGRYTLFSPSGDGPSVGVDGFVGGATVGANFQMDSWVFGVEADISNGPRGTTAQGTAGPFWNCVTGACNVDIQYFGTVRGRVGYAIDRIMVYGTGGLAVAHVRGGIFNSPQQGSGSATGWTAGGGVEWAFDQNWSVKGEYLHVNLGHLPFGTGLGTEPFRGRGNFNVFRLGVNYRF